jgi:hypothetical protein
MVPIYDPCVADLVPGDFLHVQCVCGHQTLIPQHALLHGLSLRRDDWGGRIVEEGLWLG